MAGACCLVWVVASLAGGAAASRVTPHSIGDPKRPSSRMLQLNLCNSGIASCYTRRSVREAADVIRANRPDLVTLNEICRDDVLPGTVIGVPVAARQAGPRVGRAAGYEVEVCAEHQGILPPLPAHGGDGRVQQVVALGKRKSLNRAGQVRGAGIEGGHGVQAEPHALLGIARILHGIDVAVDAVWIG